MCKSLVGFKVTWEILTTLNYCFQIQTAHNQTISQLVFIVIPAGESFFNLSSALR